MKTNAQQLAKISRYGHSQRYKKAKTIKVRRTDTWKSYAEYLQTPHWQHMRQRKLSQVKQCEHCGIRQRLEPHHVTYERIGNEWLTDLVVLCRTCHVYVQIAKRNPGMSLAQATAMAGKLVRHT